MARRYRSRREEVAQLRAALRAKNATYRHIAHVIATRYKVNSRVAYRLAHGLTQQQVADRWNELWPSSDRPTCHKHVSYWEAWPASTGRAPSLEVLNRLARIYQCRAGDLLDGEDHSGLDKAEPKAGQVPAPPGTPGTPVRPGPTDVVAKVSGFLTEAGFPATGESDFQRLVHELVEWACRMNRRDILQWLSWAAASAAAAPVLDGLNPDERERVVKVFASPQRVDDTVVDHIESVLWRCYRQDDSLGPQAVLDTTLAQRSLVRGLLDDASGTVKDRLLSLYANLSRFAGWLSFDLSNDAAAAEYYQSAREAAHEPQDTELGAFVLCSMSHLATWRGQPRIGIDYAVAAQGWASQAGDKRLQAYAADVAGRAYAKDSQTRQTEVAVERAGALLGEADAAARSTSLVYFYDHGVLASVKGECYLHLGQPERGIASSEEALRSIDKSFVRNRAMAYVDLGVCLLKSGKSDVDRAVNAIGDAARLASHNRSPRLAAYLKQSMRELEPWKDTRAVRELRDEVATYRVVV